MQLKKKILVIEDHPIFRLGLSELINQEPDLQVCGEAKDAAAAWNTIERLQPDLIIADITLENSDGIELTKEIHRHYRHIPVLILSMHDEFLYAERALHAGARGYIMKQEAMGLVVDAIHQVLEGKLYLSDQVKEHILAHLAPAGPNIGARSPIERLTDRELEIFRMIAKGLSTRDIADKLHVSIKTVGTHRERIKSKFNLKSANELVRYAVHWAKTGLIDLTAPQKTDPQ
jgi:DNA-binding NarL/FixJ family response regulator